jgi:competence protein ComEC
VPRCATLLTGAGYALAGALLAASAVSSAEDTELRAVLHARFGGFAIDTVAPAGPHPPLRARLRLTEDAVPSEDGVRLRGVVEQVWVDGRPRRADGGVLVTVSGALAGGRLGAWRAGRVLEAPITFRRPARYLTAGAGDAEAATARQGTTLLGRVKSGLSVEVLDPGGWWAEWTASVRALVRRRVTTHMAGADAGPGRVRAGIVTALLIGDRTAIPADVRSRLQAAGTFHVIAISGGNIAVLVLLATTLLRVSGAGPRLACGLAIPVLLVYAGIVTGGPSVRRAVVMAVVYLAARTLDIRAPVWNALAVSAGLLVCLHPLDVVEAGFWLTFCATVALVGAGRLTARAGADSWPRRVADWLLASAYASMFVELVILPVTLVAFSRVTLAGIAANLVAVPAMTFAQLAGLALVAGGPGSVADLCGVAAGRAADLLLAASSIVDWMPWLSPRLPAPPPWVWPCYGALLALAWRSARPRVALAALCLSVGIWANWPAGHPTGDGRLTMTALDVGQGEAILLRLPDGRALLVDTGGGTGGPETGERVVGPALWARGIRRLHGLVITHADPDHVGGAAAILRDFRPEVLWTGVRVAGHEPTATLERSARAAGVRQVPLAAGDRLALGPVAVRVLHPGRADWERPAVRNDDSVVMEVRYGDVSILLTGDAGVAVERDIVPRLAPARMRILKVGHHGSRTSTGAELVEAWAPQVAVISCGRGNGFGHPVPDVLARLIGSGATVFRTDRDGEVTIGTDGRSVTVRRFRSPSSAHTLDRLDPQSDSATNPRSPPS